jgi:hypothetical protein
MAGTRSTGLVWLAILAGFAVILAGCNSATDDPDVSDNLVSVASADPTEACVDYDGEEQDGSIVYSGVLQDITLESRPRGGSGDSVWQDVIFDEVVITYDMDEGAAPAPKTEAVQVTVPAGGTTDYPLVTVEAVDVADPTLFERGASGRIVLEFRGENVSGKPASASGNIRLFTASICGGGN